MRKKIRCDLNEFSKPDGTECTVAVVTQPTSISGNTTVPKLEVVVISDGTPPVIDATGMPLTLTISNFIH